MQNANALETLVFVSPLHCLMRSFGWAIRLLYHLRSSTHEWTESKRKLGQSHQLFTKARQEAKAAVRDATGIIMDAVDFAGHGGTTDKGDVCRRLLRDQRHVLVALVPEIYQEAFKDLLEGLWVVHTVYTIRKKINVDHYKGFCLQVYRGILQNFGNLEALIPWVNISPTVHSLLAHS